MEIYGHNSQFIERKVRSRDAVIKVLEGKLDAIADALEEHGFEIALIPVVDAVISLIRYHEELQRENDRLAELVRRYLSEQALAQSPDKDQ